MPLAPITAGSNFAGRLLETGAAEEDALDEDVALLEVAAKEEEDALEEEEEDSLSDASDDEDAGSLSDTSEEEDSVSLIDSDVLEEGISVTSLFFKSDTPMLTATINISSARATMTMEDIGDFFDHSVICHSFASPHNENFFQPLGV